MPANLNALIRYKTINSCLYGGKRRWSIPELIEKCSDALAEYRGRYEPVSERTIRDDIRVMRSDILGYNAPIEQHKGLYYYSYPDYSIMTISITDSELIERIIRFLSDIKSEVTHPELEIILGKLTKLKLKYYQDEKQKEDIQFDLESQDYVKPRDADGAIKQISKSKKSEVSERISYRAEENFEPMAPSMSTASNSYLICWGDILLSIRGLH